jgi:N6-adenosine-specific RNA methylase IME4
MIPRRHYYRVVYADPAWDFETYSKKGQIKTPHRHYACMPYVEMAALPVADWAAPDSVLLMWAAPDTFLAQALRLIEDWGFAYKAVGFSWTKTLGDTGTYFEELVPPDRYHFGQGYWTHGNPEICLLATRGSPYSYVRARDVRKLVVSPVRDHSRKPDEVYDRIERLLPGPYLEMFARTRRPGWAAWGNEVGKFGT